MGKIGNQHVQASLAAAFSPLAISTWMNEIRSDHNKGGSMPYSFTSSVGVVLRPTGLYAQQALL